MEILQEIEKKGINIAVISETKKKLKGSKLIGNHTMLYSGVSQNTRAQPGVALIIDPKGHLELMTIFSLAIEL